MNQIVFSPISMHLLRAEQSTMSEDYTLQSSVQIFNVNQTKLEAQTKSTFQTSFQCCDWSFSNYIAAGGEQGALLLTTPDLLPNAELKSISQSDISAIHFSDESENLLAVGTASGEVHFYDLNGNIVLQAQTKAGQNPHSTKVVSLTWNPRVPRVCCSLDESGTAIVWDLKKKGAVMTFQSNGGVDVCFSGLTATVMYILNSQSEIDVWDLRVKTGKQASFPVAQNASGIRLHEGVENILGVYYQSGEVASYNLESFKLVGQQLLGQRFSFVYPNLWAQLKTELTVHYRAVCIDSQPILFNQNLIKGPLDENEPELIQIKRVPISFGKKNHFRFIEGNKLMQQRVLDCDDIVEQVEAAVNGKVQLNQEQEEFAKLISESKEEQLNQIIGAKDQAKVELDVEKVEIVAKASENTDNFFDQEEAVEILEDKQDKVLTVDKETEGIMELIKDGDSLSAIHTAMNQKNFALALYLLLNSKIDQQKQIAIMNEFQKQNQKYEALFVLMNNIKNGQIPEEADWKTQIRMCRAYNKPIQAVVQKAIEAASGKDLIRLLVYAGQTTQALEIVAQNKMTLQQKIAFSIELSKHSIQFQHKELETIMQIVESQGRQDLSEKLQTSLKIQKPKQQTKIPQPVSTPVQQQHQPIQQPVNRQPYGQNLVTQNQPSMSLPVAQPQPPKNNNFFSVGGQQPIGSQPMPQKSQHLSSNADVKEPEPIYAVDIFGTQQPLPQPQPQVQPPVPQPFNQPHVNSMLPPPNNGFMQQPPQPVQPYQQPEIFRPAAPPQPGVAPPMPTGNLQYPSQNQARPPPQMTALHSRGPDLVAPLPPSVGVEQVQTSMIRVQQTTAPEKIIKAKPVQVLDISYKGLEMLSQIQLKTQLAQGFFSFCQRYQQVDNLNFSKNSAKLGDLLLHLSDFEDVEGLISDQAVNCLNTILEAFQQNNFKSIQKIFADFGRSSDELNQWSGTVKLMAIALGK
ncbi:Sec31 [Hexamita inflata]|uniref:Sec31 n=1 Tax=Hexamita inflata TaxID=28002 RepID=A0AA86NQF1_9EUKA|nr:Sec31 [Hexamita inflata]